MHAKTSLRTYEFRLRMQEQVCICRLDFAHTRTNTEGCSSIFSKFSQPELNLNMFLPILEGQVFI